MYRIERANPADHTILTQITKEGKAWWGYSEQDLEKWESDLTITESYITENETFVLIKEEQIIGYYSCLPLATNQIKLDYLFILQEYIGRGFGRILLADFLKRSSGDSDIEIILEADPNAENFYKKFGFKTYNQRESSIKGRFLPLMKFDLK